jgi:hypothetical protein
VAALNDLSQSQIPEIFRRLKALENAAPMNNGAVGRSGFEVYDGGNINISNGSITINGSLTGGGSFGWTGSFYQSGTTTFSGSTTIAGPTGITGTLTIQGSTSVTGPFTVTGATKLNGVTDVGGAFTVTGLTKLNGNTTIAGDFTVTGPTKINGTMDISGTTKVTGNLEVSGPMSTKGTLSVEGVTTLKNDLNVTTGKVKVGSMTLDPTISGGALTFANGSQVFTNTTTVQVFKGTSALSVQSDQLSLIAGGNSLRVDGAGVRIVNPTATTNAANVYMDANGYLYRKSP